MIRNIFTPFHTLLLLVACLALPLFAAQNASAAVNEGVSKEQLDTARKAAESDTTLDETQKQKTLELYDQAAKWLQQAQDAKEQLARMQTLVHQAPQRIEDIRSGKVNPLKTLTDIDTVKVSDNLDQVELALTREQSALQQARDTHREQADQLAQLLVGSKGLGEEIASATKALDQIDANLKTPPTSEPPALARARTLELKTRRMLQQTELEQYQLRLGNRELLTKLAQAEQDLAATETAERQKRLDTLSAAAQQLRENQAREAQQQAEALESKTDTLPLSLQIIARENAKYRQEMVEVVNREQSVAQNLQETRSGLEGIKSDFERTQERVDVVGTTEAIGKMLRRRLTELPSPQRYRRTSAERRAEINRATDRQIEIDELLRERSDIRAVVAAALDPIPQAQWPQYEQEAKKLADARRDALNDLQKVYGRYIAETTSLDLAERQLVEVARSYIDYIEDQLIWIPGPNLLELMKPAVLGKALLWLVTPDNWNAMAQNTLDLAQQRPLRVVAVLALFLLLLRRHRPALERLGEIARETRKIRSDSFLFTLKALFHTLVAIGAWPLLLVAAGRLLGALPNAAPFTDAMADGLVKAGMVLFSIKFLIHICLADGLGDRHLRWPQAVRDALVHELGWLLPLAVPLGFLVAATGGSDAAQGLSPLAFIALMGASALFVYRLLRGGGNLMEALRGDNGGGALAQLHFLWFPLLVFLPVSFAATSAAGYQYGAMHLEQRTELTFWFFIGLFLLRELLLRYLFIAERRLRLDDALRRRDELRAQRAHDEEGREEETSPICPEIPEVDFAGLSEQSRRLVRAGFLFGAVVGIWGIWSDLLPALGFLYSTELPIHASRVVDGVTREMPVTLGDVTVGFIMLLITVLAAKNIPGVLEITLLQRLPLDPGARYAITSLSQYVIAGIGLFAAFSTLGLQWSNIQWLIAALGVGLGFGLQEIVANFISGIILLFERPIRVGDVVTLDGTTGVVSRIRIRATTITNWDKQELLIPNKEFITGRVINWTLSDKMNRIVITVGVAYGSDTQRAMALMLEAATENENILEDPKPVTSFEGFGDNALNLVLRSYLGTMDNRLATITALHQAINDKMNAAGIAIAFPQRDMHLDTTRPLDIRLHRGK